MMRLHHTGIICRCVETDMQIYLGLGYRQLGDIVSDTLQSNRIAFLTNENGDALELIQPLNENSTIKKAAIGIHHLCYETDDLHSELKRIQKLRLGTVFTDIMPAPAFDNRRIVFIYLRTGLIIELIEK